MLVHVYISGPYMQQRKGERESKTCEYYALQTILQIHHFISSRCKTANRDLCSWNEKI